MSEASWREEQYDDPRSVYERIRNEFIILEEKERSKVLQGAFVYKEFMECVMARPLMRHWDAAAVLAGCPFYTSLEGLGRSLQQYQFG